MLLFLNYYYSNIAKKNHQKMIYERQKKKIFTWNNFFGSPIIDVENKHGHNATSVFLAQCETIRKNWGNNLIKSVTRGKSGS